MSEIGIITHYYRSLNYGGNIQAYALVTFLNNNGFDAKQICYQMRLDRINPELNKSKGFKHFLFMLKHIARKCFYFLKDLFHIREKIKMKAIECQKRESFYHFQSELIPHTDVTYNDKNIKKTNSLFSTFITGSDQVFSFTFFKKPFFLTFADKGKYKFSYAASLAQKNIPEKRKTFFLNALNSFDAISLRENDSVQLVSSFCKTTPVLTIDPTFLLTKEEWEKVTSNRIIKEKYVFCYFLGNNTCSRLLAKQFCERTGFKLAIIPMAKNRYQFQDQTLGDYNLLFSSPNDFLSLIKHSEFVFTDSFHASAFSIIFKKQFVTFNRDRNNNMSNRIISLLEMFDSKERFIRADANTSILQIEALSNYKLPSSTEKYKKLLEFSKVFLITNCRKGLGH